MQRKCIERILRIEAGLCTGKRLKKAPKISDEIQRRFLVKSKLTEVTSTVHSILTTTANAHVAILRNMFVMMSTVKHHVLNAEIIIVGKDVPNIRRAGVYKLRNHRMYQQVPTKIQVQQEHIFNI